jgi:hypothetical protein
MERLYFLVMHLIIGVRKQAGARALSIQLKMKRAHVVELPGNELP